MNIIGAEDEDFENDEQPMVDDQCSHFNSIELLKSRPTHLLVFIHHVMLQFDCAPVLCYLHADLLRNFNAKDTRKHFVEFYNTFLDKGAILRVTVPSAIAFELDRTRPEMISEDLQKRYANEVQFMQNSELSRQLEDFRQKRMMGMTPNEHELNDVESHRPTDRVPMENKEKAVAETLLERMFEANPSIVADKDKSTAIFGAVALYMKHLGVKTRALDNKKAKTGWRPSILKPWGGNKLGKPVRTPGFIHEVPIRNTVPPHRDSVSDTSTTPGRKPGLGGLGSVRGSDSTEGPIISVTVSPSPDTPSDTGINSSRADTKHVPEAGDVSPVSPVAGPTVQESPVTEVLPEESQESISMDGRSGSDGGLVAPDLLLYQEEIDPLMLEFDLDPPTWREMAFSESLSSLNKKEVKRQEVINELYVTEHAHVRMLRVLQTVFFHPMEREEILSLEELNAIFPSLDEIIEIHLVFYETLKKQREEDDYIVKAISTPLLNRFNGSEGEWFQKLTARFCSHQSWALEQIKLKQKKDPRFNAFILEAECKRQCRRLQLKDIIPIEMQRLTKYPLLLENIGKNTENDSEKELINQAAECCRKILNHVNEEVKLMENLLILRDYQRRLDTSGLKPSNDLYLEHKNIDLTARNMLFEGPLTWKVTKEKAIDVHCVLLSDLLILLQKQDDRMVLKCQSKSTLVQEGKQMLSPIIKLESVFLRDVATDPKALYVIFAWDSGAQIYELVAQSIVEKKNWAEVIKSACEQFKKTLGNKLERTRGGSIPASSIGPAFSPLHPPLSPTENGGDLIKSRIPNAQFKDLADMKRRESDTSLLYYLAVNGFDIMTHTPPEKSAVAALEEVRYLKRFLVGSISLSDDFQVLGENGEMQDGVNEATASEAVEGQGSRPDGGWISAPLVLSTDSIEEVQRRLQNLEEQVKRLQTVEEDHYKLQEALSKYSLQGGPYN